MSDHQLDCIIVGQGLAGTCLSYEFLRNKKKILVIDRDAGAACTAIAAGTFNPLVFKSFSHTWKAIELIPFLNHFYNDLASFLKTDLINSRSVVKSFKSKDQRELWKKNSTEGPASQYMQDEIFEEVQGVLSDFGFGFVAQSGNVNIPSMLSEFRQNLKNSNSLLETNFDFEQLSVTANGVRYKEYQADRIIFCQGNESKKNPYFKYLPFKLTKGEILIISSPELKSENIIHNKINIVPMGENRYWVGSTFDWDNIDTETTATARKELEEKVRETINVPFKVIEQKAGIRPTVKDRRPLLGFHPEHERLGVFNGLGTRGVMLAPFFARQFFNSIFNRSPLDAEVDINRFSAEV